VVIGPGGVGKGTLVRHLVEADRRLWLSRSWTTRARRQGEAEDSYIWVTPPEFETRIRAGGFFEWARFIDNYYGTPDQPPPPGHDLVLEIEVQGAEQVKAKEPSAVVVLLVPPSEEEQQARLRNRGDSEDRVRQRVEAGRQEIERGRLLADHVVVNDHLDRAVDEVAGIIAAHRTAPEGA
jgi:guanylate kinase